MGKLWGLFACVMGATAIGIPKIVNDDLPTGQEVNDIRSFGENNFGQLGLHHRLHWADVTSPTLSNLDLSAVTRVISSADADHAVAITSTGALVGWGRNQQGQLGVGGFDHVAPTVLIARDVSKADVSSSHTVALTKRNELFRLQNNQILEVAHPHLHIVGIAAGEGYTVVHTEDGRAFTLDNLDVSFRPVPVEGFVASVSASSSQAFLLTTEGFIWSWGDNSYGQLCVRDSPEISHSRDVPLKMSTETPYGVITSIKAGDRSTLALTEEGVLLQCGFGGFTPVFPTFDHRIISYAPGSGHSLAISASGDVYGWGKNNIGQLGVSTATTITTAEKLDLGSDLQKFAEASAGKSFSLLLASCKDSSCVHGVAVSGDNCACVCESMWTDPSVPSVVGMHCTATTAAMSVIKIACACAKEASQASDVKFVIEGASGDQVSLASPASRASVSVPSLGVVKCAKSATFVTRIATRGPSILPTVAARATPLGQALGAMSAS
jgi:alpha-tubulin suppressor-like RCC1 family protein